MVRSVLVVAVLTGLCGAAQAQEERGAQAQGYTQAVQRGHEGVRRQDWQAATDGYGEAAALRPRSAEPILFQAMMLRVRGDLAGALARFREAVRISQAAREDATRAKALL